MMQVQNQTQQIAREEDLLSLSEDELAAINGGALRWPTPDPSPNDIQRAVGEFVDKAPLDPIATFLKEYKVGHCWSFL